MNDAHGELALIVLTRSRVGIRKIASEKSAAHKPINDESGEMVRKRVSFS